MAALTTVDPDATIEVKGAITGPRCRSRRRRRCCRWRCGSTLRSLALPSVAAATATSRPPSGVPTLDGLGAVGGGAHSDREYIKVAMIPSRIRLLAGLLRQLCVADPAP